MSTAVAEPPVKTAAQAAAELPSMEAAFKTALTQEKAKETPAAEAVKTEPVKTEPAKAAEPAKTEPVKTEPVKAEPVKKRSALDTILADDVPAADPVKDEVTQLLESTNPNWDKARETMKRQSEELKTLRETSKKAAEPSPEIQTELKTLREERARLKAENDQYRDSVMAIDVKLDPGYQTKLRGRDAEVERVASYVKEAGGDPNAFIDAMVLSIAKRGKHLDAILDGIESTRARTAIEARLGKIDLVDEELETQVNQSHKTYDELLRQREVAEWEHTQKVEAFKQATYEKVQGQLPKISKFMRPAPEDAEGALEYNAQLKTDMEKAPTLLSVDPETATVLTFKAARYDTLEKLAAERFSKDAAEIAQLKADLAKFEGSEPGFRGGGKPAPKQDYERSIADVFNEALRKPEI